MDKTDALIAKVDDLSQRVADLTTEVRAFSAGQKEMCRASTEQRTRHEGTLYDHSDGLCRRVQALEERVSLWMWLVGTTFAGVLGQVGYDLWRVLHIAQKP